MIGWNISVYRRDSDGSDTNPDQLRKGERLAVWQTSADGLRWLDALVEAGNANVIAEGGYPSRYTATASHVLPNLLNEPPQANALWVCGPEDVIGSMWAGKTVIDRAAIERCEPEEWLLIEAWDES
jgi:hypothetical protein